MLRGDFEDPLAGTVRLMRGSDIVDVEVETVLPRLPRDARRLWKRVAGGE